MLQLGEEHSCKTDKSGNVEDISSFWGYPAYYNQIHGFNEPVLFQFRIPNSTIVALIQLNCWM